jgi:hypothetical protein
MKTIRALLVLVLLAGLQPEAAADTGNATLADFVSLRATGGFPDYRKALIQFAIPEAMRGRVATAATLHLFTSSTPGSQNVVSVRGVSGAWASTDPHATLDGLTLSAELASLTCPANPPLGTELTANVLGDDTKGVKKALADSEATVSLALYMAALAATTDVEPEIAVGPFGNVHGFSTAGGTAPYLEIVYEGGATVRIPRKGVD